MTLDDLFPADLEPAQDAPTATLPASIQPREPRQAAGIELIEAKTKCFGMIPNIGRCGSLAVYVDTRGARETRYCARCGRSR